MITIFFRYDDYSSLSHPAVDRGLIDIFARNQLSCTFAVVPAITSLYPIPEGTDQQELPLSAEKKAELRAAVQSGAVDLALHGWRHLANQHTGHPNPSEYKGLTLDEQVEILRRGRDFLADAVGVAPTLFVPPWNSYDGNTVKALEINGFKGISASRYSPNPAGGSTLVFAPMTTELGGIRSAIESARNSKEDDPVIGVMMHPYDFFESNEKRAVISLADFEKELQWLKAQPDVRVVPISAFIADGQRMSRERLAANRPSIFENCYPSVVDRVDTDFVYHTTAGARRQALRRGALFGAILLAIAIIGAASGWFAESLVSKWLPSLALAVPALALLAIVVLVARAVKIGAVYTRAAALLAALAGAFVASIV